jgi:hypothetical protein
LTGGEHWLGRRTAGARGPEAAQVAMRIPEADTGRTAVNRADRGLLQAGLKSGRSDWVGSRVLYAGSPRLRVGGFSQLKLSVKKASAVVVSESKFVIGRSRATELPRHISLLSASPQYGGLPNLATGKIARQSRQIRVANSPEFQRVLHCWRFARSLC